MRDRYAAGVDALLPPGDSGTDPVFGFLFTYYSFRASQLRRWHPGFGVRLRDAPEYAQYRGYRDSDGCAAVDPDFLARRHSAVAFTADLLERTASRRPHLGCFGLHEWAMVYRAETTRHAQVPLRLGAAGTDAVVESMQVRCTHFDAFRFFTPPARGRNAEELTRESQLLREQPGCIHATMDLYKWAHKLTPLVPSALTLRCFALALDARRIDMQASPYDLRKFGYAPIQIETAAGRAEYMRAQQDLTERGQVLRGELLNECRRLLLSARSTAVDTGPA